MLRTCRLIVWRECVLLSAEQCHQCVTVSVVIAVGHVTVFVICVDVSTEVMQQ